MRLITINPNNEKYYSEDFVKGFECGAKRQFEADLADRPRGEWMDADGEVVPFGGCGCVTRSAWCSECGTWLVGSDEYLVIGYFCPNCGADMRGENDESD